MSDSRSEFTPRRSRMGLLATLVVLALAVGIGLMVYAVSNSGGWFLRQPAPADPNPQRAQAYNPPQPAPAAPPIVADDPATLAARQSALAAQLAAIEARTAAVSIDAAGAADRAGRAEAILIAFAARRSVERGVPLGYLEEQIRTRFAAAQPRAVTTILQSARQPITLEDLRQGLDANAGELTSGGDEDLLTSLGREIRNLVVVHEAGTPSPLPADRLARARRLLDAGQVNAALAEVRRLPGARLAGAWLAAAQRYVDTRRALDLIESAAVIGQPTLPPVVPAVAVQPVPAPQPAAPATETTPTPPAP